MASLTTDPGVSGAGAAWASAFYFTYGDVRPEAFYTLWSFARTENFVD